MRHAVFGIASTAVSGLTNVLIQLVAAVLLGPTEFARFSIAATTATVCLGLGRAVVGQVDMLRGSPSSNDGAGDAALLTSMTLGAIGALLAPTGVAVGNVPLEMVGLGVACAAVLVFQDSLRFRSFRRARPQVALVSDTAILTVIVPVVLFDRQAISTESMIGLWAGATLLGLLVGSAWLKYYPCRPKLGLGWLRGHRDLVGPGIGEYLLQVGLPYALNFVILAVGGEVAFAGYRLAQLIFAGVGNLAAGLNAVMLPGLVDSRDPKLARAHARWEVLTLTAATAIPAALVVFLPPAMGAAVFGGNWLAMMPFLAVCAIHGWVNALAIPNHSLIRLLGFATFSFWVRVASFVITLSGAVAAAQAGAVAVAWLIAIPAVLAWIVRVARTETMLTRLIESGERIP